MLIQSILMLLNEIQNDVQLICSSNIYKDIFLDSSLYLKILFFYRSIAANNIYERGNINKNPTAKNLNLQNHDH